MGNQLVATELCVRRCEKARLETLPTSVLPAYLETPLTMSFSCNVSRQTGRPDFQLESAGGQLRTNTKLVIHFVQGNPEMSVRP